MDALLANQPPAAAKETVVPPCANRERREQLEADDIAWLMHYFGPECGLRDPFWYEFTTQQREMITAIRQAVLYGGDCATADLHLPLDAILCGGHATLDFILKRSL